MKPPRTALLAAALTFGLSAAVVAQEREPATDHLTERPAALQRNSNSGTAPENPGSTGWTGGTGGAFTGTEHAGSPDSPNQQPPLASGLDLKGPPVQFPADKTPE